MNSQKRVFVTVGSTNFDELIKLFSPKESPSVIDSLRKYGYNSIVLQYGNSTLVQSQLFQDIPRDLELTFFNFKPDLSQDYDDADLIISHAGSGSMLEGLRKGKKMIVVINSKLMGNHQLELSEQFENLGYLFTCIPGALHETIELLESKGGSQKFQQFPAQNQGILSECLSKLFDT